MEGTYKNKGHIKDKGRFKDNKQTGLLCMWSRRDVYKPQFPQPLSFYPQTTLIHKQTMFLFADVVDSVKDQWTPCVGTASMKSKRSLASSSLMYEKVQDRMLDIDNKHNVDSEDNGFPGQTLPFT